MRPSTRAKYRLGRICPACHTPNSEQGQRGDRLMHAECRAMLDAGMTKAEVCEVRRRERLLAVLSSDAHVLMPQPRIAREAGMVPQAAYATLANMTLAGVVERFKAMANGAGRTSYLYRRVQA